MFQPSVSVSEQSNPYHSYRTDSFVAAPDSLVGASDRITREETPGHHWLVRRWRRERRRRKVGRAYDMALEISREISPRRGSPACRVLDVGCGNGYIAHHLSAILGARVLGIDLDETTEAIIDYSSFDGARFPVETVSLDVVLFCYVLHHAQDLSTLLGEANRALRVGGQVVVYEDIPESGWDRFICRLHSRQWRDRTGPCTFKTETGWRQTFKSAGFEVVKTRPLSRWRNLAHPVSRRVFVMELA